MNATQNERKEVNGVMRPVVLVLTRKFSQWLRSSFVSWSLKDRDGSTIEVKEPCNWPTGGFLTRESAEQTARQYCEEQHLVIVETKEISEYD